ncbi:hypothetical protein DYB28_013575 [Aphanomyces astaci]|uniref:Uncharacterized protein n=1 Tax=Aphanomyces astaci TaxID=112090 RepID=A0A397EX52_APHAT|nr:hypothetical protein DYB36_005948 [Aphanomyces astaci]RHY24074.1 hypothetical protein DYB25_007778 [Aphanomyces astaci]RHY69982.1 hypothetical protein DYB30_011933 [Aphanomyces astaci]RHY78053.1 hypothetical protein DYB34_007102 [Aphanomyces astaci]RHZ02078.1 hypothetical protein DYB31_013931 [Aphanomyces astaci]
MHSVTLWNVTGTTFRNEDPIQLNRRNQQERMLPPHTSLVKYDSPILISTTKDKKGGNAGKKAKGGGKSGETPADKAGIPSIANASSSQTEDILNSILPPK